MVILVPRCSAIGIHYSSLGGHDSHSARVAQSWRHSLPTRSRGQIEDVEEHVLSEGAARCFARTRQRNRAATSSKSRRPAGGRRAPDVPKRLVLSLGESVEQGMASTAAGAD